MTGSTPSKSDTEVVTAAMMARAAMIREATLVISLLATVIALSATGNPTLAATALGGALGMVMPGTRNAPAAGVVMGLGAGAIAAGIF